MAKALKKNEDFSALFDHAGIGIMCVATEGSILAANSLVLEEFGYNERELIGERVEKLMPQHCRNKHSEARQEFMDHLGTRNMTRGAERMAVKKDGTEFPVEVTLGHYKNKNGEMCVMAFIKDITKRKEAQAAMQLQNELLEQKVAESTKALRATVEELTRQMRENELKDAELLKALAKEKELSELKSRFVSIASHEFRTPLTSIAAATYLLSKYGKEDEQHLRDKHIGRIHASITALTELLDDFLSIDKMDDGPLAPVYEELNVSHQVEACMQDLQHLQQNGHAFNYENNNADAHVTLDHSMFRHILTNLLSNAVKYSPSGSVVRISTEKTGNRLVLKVADSGMGIPQKDQKNLFKRFFRASNAHHVQGTGLGLTIVKKYVELMGGIISFVSEEGKGTTFTLTFKDMAKTCAHDTVGEYSGALP